MKTLWCCLALVLASFRFAGPPDARLFLPDNPLIRYTGRIDFSNKLLPRFWNAGVYIDLRFSGNTCKVILTDEKSGQNFNYLEVVLDNNTPLRIRTRAKRDTLDIPRLFAITPKGSLSAGYHILRICKDTESGIGYLEFAGVICQNLLALPPPPHHKIECIGNSITCGTGMDQSKVPCHTGLWHDQHNAYLSYGAITARNLNASWQLTSVSGIGLMHSCCKLEIVMKDVFDKINLRSNQVPWNFSYIPDIVTICLGQNDGMQDTALFRANYLSFIRTVRLHYPAAHIVCLSSPMADSELTAYLQQNLPVITGRARQQGDKKVSYYFFKKRYHNGCDDHPDMAEHLEIAGELTACIKRLTNW